MVSATALRPIIMLAAFSALVAQQAFAVRYSECDAGSLVGSIKSLDVSDCPTDNERCIFKRDTNKTIEIKFVPNEKLNSAKVNVKGRVGKADMPFLIHPDDACSYGVECPLDAGKEQTFKLSLPIKKVYPPIKVDVFIRLQDENKKTIICADIPAKIE